jgi:hypothetical protein
MVSGPRARFVSRRRLLAAAVLGLPAIGGGALVRWTWGGSEQSPGRPDADRNIRRRETRPTLDPARFNGKAARAHQVARDIPDVLDQLHCYCGCDRSVGHVSLLSCYTDNHAVT